MEIKIDPEFQGLLPATTEAEYADLEKLIIADGKANDELVVWHETLLDGHNRLKICQEHNLPYLTRFMDFPDREQAKLWIINNQLSRRNLTPDQMSYLRGLRYNLEKKEVGHPENQCAQNEHKAERTAEKIAKETGVSPATIRRDAKFAQTVDKLPADEKREVLGGKSGKTKSEIVNPTGSRKAKPNLSLEQREVLNGLKSRWMKASPATKKAFLEFIDDHSPGLGLVIPADVPPLFRGYMERLRRAWDTIPKRVPELNDYQRSFIEEYAEKFFFLLEPFIKVQPSDKFITRINAGTK